MRTAKAQATAIAAQLRAALDVEPDIDDEADHIRVQVALPVQLTPTQRTEILIALSDADRYGHSTKSRTVWALINKDTRP